MARTFGGADYVTTGIGGLVGIGSSAHSLWAICRRGADGAWHTPLSIETSANSSKLAMQFSDTNKIQLIIGAANKDTTVGITSSDGWVLAGVSRASGSSVPRGHKYVYSSNTWTHTDAGAATGGDSTDLTGGRAQIGRWQTTDFFNGDILEVGAVKRALSDAEWENLPFTLLGALGMAPDGLWLLDQHATSQAIGDLTGGGAGQTSLTNTSIATTSVPVWSYGAGAVAVGGRASSGGPVTLGQVVETNTATALTRTKRRTLGQPVETDTATAITRSKTANLGRAVETDTATAVTRAKSRTLGQPTETNTATALTRTKRCTLGQPVETDTAGALTVGSAVVLGQALDTQAALPFTRSKRRPLGQAVEVDTAAALGVTGPSRQLVVRPHAGTVVRPNTGTVTRPNTGLVIRP